MFDAMVHRIVNMWVSSGIATDEDRDVIEYGLDLLIFSFINIIAVMVTAMIMNRVLDTLLLLAVIIPLQSFGGGFHAKTHLRCFLIMYIGWWAVMALLPWITAIPATIITVLSVIAVFCLAPVAHENVPMSERQRVKMRRFARIASVTVGALCLSFLWLLPALCHAGIVLSMGMGTIMVSMIIGWIVSELRNEVRTLL